MATEQRKLAAIMFTDMVGYSALAQRDDKLALELLEEHRQLLREIFPRFNGTEIKTIGDAFLIEFQSALAAAQCAIEIQRTLAKRNHDVTAERRIELKIGIHLGDVVHRDGDVYGDGVNIASRIEPLAGAGGICVSMDVERQIRNALEARFEKLAPTELKNISVAMDLFRIVLPWEHGAKAERAETSVRGRSFPASRLAWVGAIVLAVVGAGWWFAHQAGRATKQGVNSPSVSTSRAAPSTAPATGQKSVAVLPFVNLSPDKADEYLSDGMTEELLNALAKVKGLHVPGRTSSFAFKGRNEEGILRRVGEQLRVNTVLEGSVRKAGTRLRITAQLINVADGFHLWSETYDREMADIFAIQSDVAQRVATALKGQLLAGEREQLARKPTENLEAYGLYLKGRYHMIKDTEEAFRKAIESYEMAIELDPNYALAYAGLADAYMGLGGVWGFVSPTETLPKSRAAALKAIELDETLAEAHLALAGCKFYEWNWEEAERELKRALELNPNIPGAHAFLGGLLQGRGRFNEAIAARRQAQNLDPLRPDFTAYLGYPYFLADQYDQAIACYREALEMDPNYFWASLWLGEVFVQQGEYDKAISELNKAVNLSGRNVRTVAELAHAYAVSGKRDEAMRLLDELKQRSANAYVAPYFIAIVHAGLGEKDETFEWLDKAYQERFIFLYWLNVEPVFDDLHSDPRFVALLKKVGLDK